MNTITWAASNNSTYMTSREQATSMRAAVIAARSFISDALGGEGEATIFVDGQPVMKIERSISTKFQWVNSTNF